MRDEFANRLHAEWCGCDSWDGVNCEDYHEREFPEQADAVMPLVVEALGKRQGKLQELVAASLVFDYTAEGEAAGYTDDPAEQAAALANILEMHRLLTVRQERLSTAHAEIDRLRAENARLKSDVSAYKAALDIGEELLVIGEYLCQKVDDCTCGADLNAGYGHEPYCGVEPVAKLARVRAALSGVSETPEATE